MNRKLFLLLLLAGVTCCAQVKIKPDILPVGGGPDAPQAFQCGADAYYLMGTAADALGNMCYAKYVQQVAVAQSQTQICDCNNIQAGALCDKNYKQYGYPTANSCYNSWLTGNGAKCFANAAAAAKKVTPLACYGNTPGEGIYETIDFNEDIIFEE